MKMIATLMMCSFSLGVFPPVLAGGEITNFTLEDEVLSVRLKEIPLKIILEKLEREEGIWFRGNSYLLDETITVQFTNLPLEQGLNRILASMNYSLVFDRNERLVGVIVVARGTVDSPLSEVRTDSSMKTITSQAVNERANANRPVTKTGKKTFQGGHIKGTKEDREGFTVVRNRPPPGGAVEVPTGARESFVAVNNCPPPGDPVKVSEEELESFKIISDIPPPGGPVEISAQELENFKVIKNCPPPGL